MHAVPLQHTASYDAQVSEWLWGKVGSGPAPEISVPMKLAEGLRWVAGAGRQGTEVHGCMPADTD